jgi:hypothetical protein
MAGLVLREKAAKQMTLFLIKELNAQAYRLRTICNETVALL